MNRFLFACMALGLALLGAMNASGAGPPTQREFELRIVPLRYLVLDPHGSYRYSEMYPKLEETELMARFFGMDSPERARALELMALAQFRQGNMEETIRIGEECLSLNSAGTIQTEDRLLLLQRVAIAADQLHRYTLAADRYRAVLALDASVNGALLDDVRRLGLLERIGYVLHEDGRYTEALTVNRKMLADAERIFGHDDERLTTVLIGLAQNLRKLGQLDEAQTTLERCLRLAQKARKNDVVDEALFQLGVLAFERGDVAGARRRMQERVKIAEQAHDADRIARAKESASQLETLISKH